MKNGAPIRLAALVAAFAIGLAAVATHDIASSLDRSEPARPSCHASDITASALASLTAFESGNDGTLFGVKTHRTETRLGIFAGYYSCPLVAYAILKNAGCRGLANSTNAKLLFDTLVSQGWTRPPRPKAGCLVAWNSQSPGSWEPLLLPDQKQKPPIRSVQFRQLGVTITSWLTIDNSSMLGRPIPFILNRPWHYHSPILLCPPNGQPESIAEASAR